MSTFIFFFIYLRLLHILAFLLDVRVFFRIYSFHCIQCTVSIHCGKEYSYPRDKIMSFTSLGHAMRFNVSSKNTRMYRKLIQFNTTFHKVDIGYMLLSSHKYVIVFIKIKPIQKSMLDT